MKAKVNLLLVCTLLLSGCGTIQSVSNAKNHVGNVDLRVNEAGSSLEYRSSPGYRGAIPSPVFGSCTDPRFFVGAGFFNTQIEQVKNEFLDVSPMPWYPARRKQKAAELLSQCDILVFEEPMSSSQAVRLNFVNNRDETLLTYQLERRDSVPLKDWPTVSLAALFDIPLVLISAPFIVLSLPFMLFEDDPQIAQSERAGAEGKRTDDSVSQQVEHDNKSE